MMRNKERLRNCHKLEVTKGIELISTMWYPDWILEQKNDICGKTDEIQIKSLWPSIYIKGQVTGQ